MRSYIESKLNNNRAGVTRDFNQAARTTRQVRQATDFVRAKSTVDTGVVNPTDPDIRKMLTAPMQGIVPVIQGTGVGMAGRIAIDVNTGATDPRTGTPLLTTPGQAVLLYPSGAGDTGLNTVSTRTGQVRQKSHYPVKLLVRATHAFVGGDTTHPGGTTQYTPEGSVMVRSGADFLHVEDYRGWDENSPLPPGMRYVELVDMAAIPYFVYGPVSGGETLAARMGRLGLSTVEEYYALLISAYCGLDPGFSDYDKLLPKDTKGRFRPNMEPVPQTAFWHLDDYYNQDKYWTGECDDPLNWNDYYWQGLDRDPTGNTPRVDMDGLATYLQAHPNAQLR